MRPNADPEPYVSLDLASHPPAVSTLVSLRSRVRSRLRASLMLNLGLVGDFRHASLCADFIVVSAGSPSNCDGCDGATSVTAAALQRSALDVAVFIAAVPFPLMVRLGWAATALPERSTQGNWTKGLCDPFEHAASTDCADRHVCCNPMEPRRRSTFNAPRPGQTNFAGLMNLSTGFENSYARRRNHVHCNPCCIHSARTATARPDCRRHRRTTRV